MSQLNAVCGTDRKSQVDQQLDNATSSIERANDRLESLIARLRPVLDTGKGQEIKPCAPECVLVPVADRIRRLDNGIGVICEKIEAMLSALEI